VHSGRKTLMHYFSCSSGTSTDFIKSTPNMLRRTCVWHPVGSSAHVVHSAASRTQKVNTQFFMLVWDQYRFQRKRVETRYTKLVFLYLVASMGHVVHSNASGGVKRRHTILNARMGSARIPQKVCRDKLCQSCVFTFGGMCGSCSLFLCV
jgi:hypothetical protein